ncbi:MAG: hypothetical protein JXR48_12095 [Candidatus Delongbacteria bacterium]|nr:hypothetical protein [Candidatus Delongbacteria bacterium]
MEKLIDFEYLKFIYREGNLHDVFGTKLDTYSSIDNPNVIGHIYLWELLQKIKYNLIYDIDCTTFLTDKYVEGSRNNEYDKIKAKLPATCYNATFNKYKNLANTKSITNLMFLDVDDFSSKEEALKYKSEITEKYDWIISCNLSLSKLGLHIIILVDRIFDNNDFNKKYDFISKTYFNGKLDKTSKSLTRYVVIPYDYNIYINESPKKLYIDSIINKKGIRSVSDCNTIITDSNSHNGKGIRSVSNENNIANNNNEKGTRSVLKKKRIISTPYTFSPISSLKETLNLATRKNSLKFREEVDEEIFTDKNIPLYYHEGVNIVEINLYQYRNNKVNVGSRNVTIGAISAQLIYLNIYLPNNNDPKIREGIIKAMVGINKKICNPPLTYKEVFNSVTANFKKYDEGNLDFSKYFRKKRAFWSKRTTLKGNEKRKVTCKIKNEPIVQESKRKIKEAIELLKGKDEKVTQQKVADISGLSLGTVKKYRKYYKEINQSTKQAAGKENNNSTIKVLKPHQKATTTKTNLIEDVNLPELDNADFSEPESDLETDLKNNRKITFHKDVSSVDIVKKPNWSDEEIHEVFLTIFPENLKRFNETQEKELFTEFTKHFNNLSNDEKELLMTPYENIGEDKFFKKGDLHNKMLNLCIDVIQLIQESKEMTV